MKTTMIQVPDEETLKRYWGSAEAFIEEQRRTASYDLESNLVATSLTTNNSLLGGTISKRQIHNNQNRLHLPFSFKNFN